MSSNAKSGFTLVELMIVVAVIAVLTSIALPKFLSTRLATNENAAIETLRSIASAEAQLQSACAIDTNADGGGEYGFIGELAGSAPLRMWDPATHVPALDSAPLEEPILPSGFRGLVVNASGHAIVERSGYLYEIFLPGPVVGTDIPGIPETGAAGVGGATVGNFPDPQNCEILWCCYAWPSQAGRTGNRTFFIDQEGDVIQTLNKASKNTMVFYDGPDGGPAFDAAYNTNPIPITLTGMGASMAIITMGITSNDGNPWTVVEGSN